MNRVQIMEQYEEAYDSFGIKPALGFLEATKAELRGMLRDVDKMIDSAREAAVAQGIAQYVEDEPRELAPSKEKFIALFGQETFDRVKTYSKPRRIFTWLI